MGVPWNYEVQRMMPVMKEGHILYYSTHVKHAELANQETAGSIRLSLRTSLAKNK